MTRPAKESIDLIREQIMTDLDVMKRRVGVHYAGDAEVQEALASVETFVNIALGVFSQTNPSKLREHMRIVELRSLISPDAPR